MSHGGVGYNITQCLQRLGASPVFITCGETTSAFGLDMRTSGSSNDVATYMAVLDQKGECKIGFGDMKAHDTITPDLVAANISALEEAPIIIIDGNIPLDTMNYVLKMAETLDKPVFFEPTDTRKSTKPFQVDSWKALKFISPNINELMCIGKFLGWTNDFVPNLNNILKIGMHVAQFIDNTIVTMGQNGILYLKKNSNSAKHYELVKASDVVSVSGAGDCFVAGFILATLLGKSQEICMSVAFESAKMSIMSKQSVPNTMFDVNHECWSTKSEFKILK